MLFTKETAMLRKKGRAPSLETGFRLKETNVDVTQAFIDPWGKARRDAPGHSIADIQ